jgi:integrase/recombinase XerD
VATSTTDRLDDLVVEHATWLAVERGLRPNTLAAYRRDLQAYTSFLRARQIDDPTAVSEQVIRAYVSDLGARRNDDGSARYAPASIARALVAVRSLHRFCAEEGGATTDAGADVRAPRVARGIPKALSEADVERLLDAVVGNEPRSLRDRAILETLYAAGLRISELVGLDRADLDFHDGLVRVFGKGGKERIAPIGRMARQALEHYLDAGRPVLDRSGARRAASGDAVFLNVRGTRLTRQGCWRIVHHAAERVGLAARVSPHVLRHSCATHLLDHGADIRVVQELLGHASVSTTQIYTLVSPERLRATFEAAHPRARTKAGQVLNVGER